MNKRVFLLFSFLISLILFNSFVLAQDLNNDGIVDICDLSIVARALGSKPGDPKWNQNADLNKDGKIDINDLTIVANNLGKTSQSKPSGISSVSPLSLSNIISWFKNLFSASVAESLPKTKVYFDPIKIVDPRLTKDNTFTVDLNIYDVTDLTGWEAKLLYNYNVLKVTNVVFSDFLGDPNDQGKTFPYIQNKPEEGFLGLLNIMLPPYERGKDGSGRLVTITFQVIGQGESNLDFFDPNGRTDGVILTSSVFVGNDVVQIEHTVKDGYFNNYPGMKIQYSIMRPSSGVVTY
jgi:hypothetical protein